MSTPYFYFVIFGYLAGILATIVAMFVMERGQPALLYLVPGCLLSVLLCAFLKMEFKELFQFDENKEFEAIEEIITGKPKEKNE
jgi:minor histocompatibility antigen H13